MNQLDNPNLLKKLDKSQLLASVQQLGLQCQQTYQELKKIKLPSSYRKVDKIVVNGMGGSRLGARVAERLFADKLKLPLIPLGNYQLPAYVDEKTLLILSSYSGNTEEILAAYTEAKKRKAKIMILAQGGELAKIGQENHYPGYFSFQPKYNRCGQPRMSLGYQILGQILLLAALRLLPVSEKEIKELISFLKEVVKRYDFSVSFKQNFAKQLAQKFYGRIPVLIGAEFVVGALHAWRNQLNENAKNLAYYFEIPELNHHLLEGLSFPKTNPQNLFFIFLESDLYHPRNQKRITITQKVLTKLTLKYEKVKLSGKNRLNQAFETIQLGSFVSFYLAMLNQLDPSPIPWVDFFKKELA